MRTWSTRTRVQAWTQPASRAPEAISCEIFILTGMVLVLIEGECEDVAFDLRDWSMRWEADGRNYAPIVEVAMLLYLA